MKPYRSHKVVEAAQLAAADFRPDGSGKIALSTGEVIEVPAGFASRSVPDEGDYVVRYMPGGYLSHSPRAAFEDGYRPLTAMTFGGAIEALKVGYRVARSGWNGKGMWLAITSGSVIPASSARGGAALAQVHAEHVAEVTILPHIDMRAADGSIVIGWLASQTDMLANDWVILDHRS